MNYCFDTFAFIIAGLILYYIHDWIISPDCRCCYCLNRSSLYFCVHLCIYVIMYYNVLSRDITFMDFRQCSHIISLAGVSVTDKRCQKKQICRKENLLFLP